MTTAVIVKVAWKRPVEGYLRGQKILVRGSDARSRAFVLVWVRDSFNFTVYDCKEQRFRVMSVDLGEMHKRLGAAIKVQP